RPCLHVPRPPPLRRRRLARRLDAAVRPPDPAAGAALHPRPDLHPRRLLRAGRARPARPHPPPARRAGGSAVRLALGAHGEGAPVLLVHGLGYTREGWGPLRALLARRYRVLSYDNRGIGESEIPPGPYTVAELASDAEQVLDEASLERADVIGASLGGM